MGMVLRMRLPGSPFRMVLAALGLTLIAEGVEATNVPASPEAAARELLTKAVGLICPHGIMTPEAISRTGDRLLAGFSAPAVHDRGPSGRWVQRRIELENSASDQRLSVSASRTSAGFRRISFEVHAIKNNRPVMLVTTDGRCEPAIMRSIRYTSEGMAEYLVEYEADLETVRFAEPLNPRVPEATDPGGVTVAQIDSGVNYLLPQVAQSLARDSKGRLVGVDLWDLDDRPFDADTSRSVFFPVRHGTAVASILLKEAPGVRLVPIRYPRPDMSRMADAVKFAADAGADIVAMPLGSANRGDWRAFADAARAHRDILFVVSAGNDDRDIDDVPVYPASLGLANVLTVTSADAFGRLATGSNWGRKSVDVMVPAERLEVIDHRGARAIASGSSYAVPRVAALAARLKKAHPGWTAADLKQAILKRAVAPLDRGPARVASGWIPNPSQDH